MWGHQGCAPTLHRSPHITGFNLAGSGHDAALAAVPHLGHVRPSSSRDVATIRMRSTFTMAAHTPPRLTAAWGAENTKLVDVGVSLSKDFRYPPNQPPSHIANCSYGATSHAVTPSCVLSYEVVMQEPLPRQSAARPGACLAQASCAPQHQRFCKVLLQKEVARRIKG